MDEGDRLRAIAAALQSLAERLDEDYLDGSEIDVAISQLRAVRRRRFGAKRASGSARERLRSYFLAQEGEIVEGEELQEISGISEWARRVRELREDGMPIEELGGSRYRLMRREPGQ